MIYFVVSILYITFLKFENAWSRIRESYGERRLFSAFPKIHSLEHDKFILGRSHYEKH